MTSKSRSDPVRSRMTWVRVCLGLTLLAPLTVFIAVAGLRAGLWNITVAFDLLAMKVALGLAGLGGLAALVAAVVGISAPKRAGLTALLALAVSAATIGVFAVNIQSASQVLEQGDVSTNVSDTPGYSTIVMAQRQGAGADPVPAVITPSGCQVTGLTTQVAPYVAAYSLQSNGFEVNGYGVGRADGNHTSFWFDVTDDAVVRIRPGQTDVRVTARDFAHDRGQACRLARRILVTLNR